MFTKCFFCWCLENHLLQVATCPLFHPITSLSAKGRIFLFHRGNLDSRWSPVCPWSPVSLPGIVTPAQILISMADHPTLPQPHVAPHSLWGWTSQMENKGALSAEHSISCVVCRLLHLTAPVWPEQDSEQCTQLASQEMVGFFTVSCVPRCAVTDTSYTHFERHKLTSLRNRRTRPNC